MKGIIYCIECNDTGDKYIGSTIRSLHDRLIEHRADVNKFDKGTKNKKCTSYFIIKNDNYKHYPLEELDINERTELAIRERYFIENTKCVNIVIPKRTPKEFRSTQIICECGGHYTLPHKLRHFRSTLHQEYLNTK